MYTEALFVELFTVKYSLLSGGKETGPKAALFHFNLARLSGNLG